MAFRQFRKSRFYQFYKYRLWQLATAPYYAVTTSGPGWRFINRRALGLYRNALPQLDSLQERLVRDLEHSGIAVANVEELLGKEGLVSRLQQSAQELSRIEQLTNPKKTFLLYFMRSDKKPIELVNPFVELALEAKILEVVSAYLCVFPRLRFVSGNVAKPMVGGADSEGSQRWHRDPGVWRICKVFLYLNDVDEGAGPFTCVAGSQPGGPLANMLPHRFFGQGSYYPAEGLVEKKLHSLSAHDQVKVCTGRAGTIIFCNTMVLHKGGYSTERPRTMTTFYYEATSSMLSPGTRFTNFEQRLASLPLIAQEALK